MTANFFEPVFDTYFFCLIFFDMDYLFKVFIEFVITLFLLYVLIFLLLFSVFVFYHKAWRILAAWLEIEPTAPALESEVSTTGQPEKSMAPDILKVWVYLLFRCEHLACAKHACFLFPLLREAPLQPLFSAPRNVFFLQGHLLTTKKGIILIRFLLAAKSLQSCPILCDPTDGSHQAPPSLGFSRQEHWNGLPFPSPMHESEKWKGSCSVVPDS